MRVGASYRVNTSVHYKFEEHQGYLLVSYQGDIAVGSGALTSVNDHEILFSVSYLMLTAGPFFDARCAAARCIEVPGLQ